MPDTKVVPAETDDAEDAELTELARSVTFDEASMRSMLAKRGLEEDEINIFIGPMKQQADANAKMLARQQRQEMSAYQQSLREQFPSAFDADGRALAGGLTKAELRRNAERLHKHTESIVGAAKPVATAAATAAAAVAAAAAAKPDARAEEWGAPPAASGEFVREIPDATWDALRHDAVKPGRAAEADAQKEAVLNNIKAKGPRQIVRPTYGSIVSRQAQAIKPS